MTAATSARDIILLNASYEELGKLSFNKAMRLLALGKAVVHEVDETKKKIKNFAYPKIIRLVYYVKVNYTKLYGEPLLSKHGILKRDGYKCCYCGSTAKTIDHLTPRSRGGGNSWLNLVAACFSCNNRKDNRTPEEAGMKLLFQPFVPTKMQLRNM